MAEDEGQGHPKLVVLVGDDLRSLQTVLRGISPQVQYAIVVIVPSSKDSLSALRSVTALPVIEVTDTVALEAAKAFVVHPDLEIVIDRTSIRTAPQTAYGSRDRVLRSIAEQFGRDATVVVLGGHDGDGALGIKRIRETGGIVLCERVEPGSSGGLPRAALTTGVVDIVVPVEQIAGRLSIALHNETIPLADTSRTDDALRDILAMIRIRTGHDFAWYKRATLYRRLARRMQVCQVETVFDYHRLLRETPSELINLLRDFLISVTNFFRDHDAFAQIEAVVIPRMFKNKTADEQVRVWVAGCATGEEAYSIGMLLCEYAGTLASPPQLQIFATDIDEEALQEARAGLYSEQIATDVSPERLQRFFTRENAGFRVTKELREMTLFSPHNVLRDPPFSRLDLISCRNLLIYLNREAQERVLNTFHFGLRSEGLLFLGSSESAEGMQHFGTLDAKNRIFERRIAPAGFLSGDKMMTPPRWTPMRAPYPTAVVERPVIASFGELHLQAIEQYAPPSVLVNDDLDVMHMSEHVGRYFEIPGGEPTRQILRLVQPALRFELRGALYAVKQSGRGSDTRRVRVEQGGQVRVVEIRVRAVALAEAEHGTMLVMFDDIDEPHDVKPAVEVGSEFEPLVRDLEDQLHRTREQLRTTIEQYETSLEELKASNEELHAINEELRSATEELETSKEELQSVNEELTTVNHELKVKVDEVSRANSDLQNLMTSTDIGVLFLDRSLHIKRFTPRMHDLFNLIPSDLGRPLAHVTHRLDTPDLPKVAERVLADLHSTEREVMTDDGRRFLTRLLPYRSMDDRIDGVVMTFTNVTDLKLAQEARSRSEAALRTSEERLTLALNAAPLAVISHDAKLQLTWAFVHGKQLGTSSLSAANIFDGKDAERYQTIVRDAYAGGAAQRAELEVVTVHGVRTYDFRIEATWEGQLATGVTSVGFDISPSKLAEQTLRDADRRKDEFLAMLSHELRNPLTPLRVAFDVARLAQNDPQKLAASLVVMDRQLQLLVRLVDDLLDLSRIAQGKIDLVPAQIDPMRAAEAALEACRPFIDEHKHKIRVHLDTHGTHIVADLMRLTQMLTNLLMNAAKYTLDGGEIDLDMRTDTGQNRLVIAVRDTGIGLSPGDLNRVFDLYMQSRSGEGRREGGIGIGLALVRRLAELHGGTVNATSDGLGKGSTFTIELPVVRNP